MILIQIWSKSRAILDHRIIGSNISVDFKGLHFLCIKTALSRVPAAKDLEAGVNDTVHRKNPRLGQVNNRAGRLVHIQAQDAIVFCFGKKTAIVLAGVVVN